MHRYLRRAVLVPALALCACQSGPSKEDLETAKQTIDCHRDDERILIRFVEGEARLLMADDSRVVLYQVQVASGTRYTNGLLDLRGKGLDYTLAQDGTAAKLVCKHYEIPKKE